MLDVRLLGGFSVSTGGEPIGIDAFERPSGARLLALLALQPTRRLHREQAIDALWPDATLSSGANQLNKAATFARKALGRRDVIVTRHDMLELGPELDVRVDVDVVRSADTFDPDSVAVALEAYRGELLPEELYAEWTHQARAELDQKHRQLLDVAPAGHPGGPAPPPTEAPMRTFGRAAELDELAAAITAGPVVTIVGAGGCGKTHLARALAARLAPEFVDGAAVCELGNAVDNRGTTRALLDGIGARQHQDTSVMTSIVRTLARRETLVVLDNCEQVLGSVRAVVVELRSSCPGVRIVCTSRRPLGLDDETVHRLAPLDESAAVELFAAEARRLGADVDWADPLVGAICRRLDHLPLALQLAGARAATIDLVSLDSLLSDRLGLLTEQRDDPRGLPHHRTLEAAFSWSHDALAVEHRTLLRSLAVLAGPFDLDTARAIAPPDSSASDVIDGIARLVRDSLLERTADGYRMLESVRSFALSRPGDDLARGRHLRHFIGRAQAWDHLLDRDLPAATTGFGRDWNDIRSAFRYASAMDDRPAQLELLAACARHAATTNRIEVGEWCRQAEATDGPTAHRARALVTGALLDVRVREQQDAAFAQGRAGAALAPDDPYVRWASAYLAMVGHEPDRAMATLRALADDPGAGRHEVILSLGMMVLIGFQHGTAAGAELDELRGLAAAAPESHRGVLSLAEGLRGWADDPIGAIAMLDDALAWAHETECTLVGAMAANTRSGLAQYALPDDEALEKIVDHLRWVRAAGLWASAAAVFISMSPLLRRVGRHDIATVAVAARSASTFVSGYDRDADVKVVEKLRRERPDEFDTWWARGSRMDIPTATDVVLDELAGTVGGRADHDSSSRPTRVPRRAGD